MIAIIILSATKEVNAQVTIGSTVEPQQFSVVELISQGKKGLRLPQFDFCQQKALTERLESLPTKAEKDAAEGLQIFNTATKCVETWNGKKWIQKGVPNPDYIEMTEINCGMCVPTARFMKYNLGANPDLDTPKKQMEYMATHSFNDFVANICGDLYQWGRVNDGHEKRSSGNYPTNDNTAEDLPANNDGTDGANLDANGQIKDDNYGKGKFIKNGLTPYNGDPYKCDWRSTQQDNLWSNGESERKQDDYNGGILYQGEYCQNTDWDIPANNPCPYGFRIPTQDEWERICDYDCKPHSNQVNDADVEFKDNALISNPISSGLTWIPVVCNRGNSGKCVPDNVWEKDNTAAGFAVYKEEVWTAAVSSGGVYSEWTTKTTNNFPSGKSLHDADAPEPLLFLPAAGNRSNGTGKMNNNGLQGYYWSSTIHVVKVYHLFFYSKGVAQNTQSPRAYGHSVRCVVD
ncbi:MAG: hypothetical protein LBS54_05315 [Dysgonamonadaceae bacterium]|nr:hypothetical protein [Dysgonamonadaceae bacterium]